ncbi:coiled-coil domain-containing protein [Helicobacter mesocricetorum]|uniref:hypothetical protein n=1 Tax=Helicobacter mesocricetorum TaxID=87012 RepID=UPI000CF01D76|nr:hypothetical protein [Helicobacter mesocricetorum]
MENIAINIAFTLIMVALAVWDFVSYGKQKHRDFKSIIMSTGVLGTFVGIFVGLQDFDVANIENSVPFLLGGLKIAFYTSILGMGLAILLSVIQKSKAVKSDFENMLEYFSLQISKLDKLGDLENLAKILEQNRQTHKLQENYYQMQSQNFLMLKESFQATNQSLKEAMYHLAQGASKELMTALEEVIKDFNQRITDQFGDNFKELNNAVSSMVKWQEHYKDSVESLGEHLKNTLSVFESSTKSLELITKRDEEILEVYESLAHSIEASRIENEKLSQLLAGFSTMHEDASKALHCVEELTKTLESSHSQTLDLTKVNLESVREFFKQSLKEHQSNTQELLTISLNTLEEDYKKSSDNLASLQERFENFNECYLLQNKENFENFAATLKDKMQHYTQEIYDKDLALKEKNAEILAQIQLRVEEKIGGVREIFDNTLEKLNNAQRESLLLIENQAKRSDDLLIQHTQSMELSLEKANKSLQEVTQETSEQLSRDSHIIQEHITNAIVNFDALLGNTTKTLEENFKTSKETLMTLSKEIETAMTTTTKSLDTLLNDTANTLSQSTQNIEESFIHSSESITQNLNKTTDEMHNSVHRILEYNKQHTKSFEDLMQHNIGEFTQHIRTMIEKGNECNKEFQNQMRSSFGESYKNALEVLAAYLKNTTATYQNQLMALNQKSFEELKKGYHQTLQSHQNLQKDLQERLEMIAKATQVFTKELLQNSKTHLDSHSQEVIAQYSVLEAKIKDSLESMAKGYMEMLSLLTKQSLELPKNASAELLNEFNNLQKNLGLALDKTYLSLENNRKEIDEILKITQENVASSLSQTSNLNENLCKSLGDLDSVLSNITLGFRQDYEWFLRRIRELMGVRN